MSLSIYPEDLEEKIHSRREGSRWRRSGLITGEQMATIKSRTRTDLKRTNPFFRALFFIFTLLALSAVTGLVVLLADLSRQETGMGCLVFGAASYIAAEALVMHYRLYRSGPEEALLIGSVVLIGIAIFLLFVPATMSPGESLMIGCAWVSFAFGWLYLRFGHCGSAVIGIGALCVIPFQTALSPELRRLTAILILSVFFLSALLLERMDDADFKKAQYRKLQSLLPAGIYGLVNLRLTATVLEFTESVPGNSV